jgi:hypothetical protein
VSIRPHTTFFAKLQAKKWRLSAERLQSILRSWRAPLWILALVTGAKSFADNPILGSKRLNRAGLHVWRVRSAHALARRRRSRLARLIPQELREQFDRDGFVIIPEAIPTAKFAKLRADLFETAFDCRSQQQGDTITRRIAAGLGMRRRVPGLGDVLESRPLRALLAYVATARTAPLYYIQTIFGGVADGPPDPQTELHSDTFHPSLKAWLFLTDVEENGRPLLYIPGSHRLTARRLEWERQKSIEVMQGGDRLSQRGSLRVRPDELRQLGLPQPIRFCVRANTLVVIDTCGFHGRSNSQEPSVRAELWAYCRRNPFLPWVTAGPLSWSGIASRQMDWLYRLVDALDRLGLKKQHWIKAGRRRPLDSAWRAPISKGLSKGARRERVARER